MARPRKTLTAQQIKQIEKLAPVLTQEQIADFFGISDDTLRRRMLEDPRVLRAYKTGRSVALNMAGGKLMTLVRRGNLGALCFYLKTQGRWKETIAAEVSGPGGGPIEHAEVVHVYTPANPRFSQVPAPPAPAAVNGNGAHPNGNGNGNGNGRNGHNGHANGHG